MKISSADDVTKILSGKGVRPTEAAKKFLLECAQDNDVHSIQAMLGCHEFEARDLAKRLRDEKCRALAKQLAAMKTTGKGI